MIDSPKGVWRWLSDNTRDLSRIAASLEKIAEEIARIRATLETDKKEDGGQ
jgi:hypothetical protein